MSSKHDLLPPTFNRLAWSNLAAQSAEQIALAAAPIVAVLLLSIGEGESGLLQTALTLPFILFAIPAGLLADRTSRRWLMAGAEASRAFNRLRPVSAEHLFERPHQRRPLFELGRVMRPHRSA